MPPDEKAPPGRPRPWSPAINSLPNQPRPNHRPHGERRQPGLGAPSARQQAGRDLAQGAAQSILGRIHPRRDPADPTIAAANAPASAATNTAGNVAADIPSASTIAHRQRGRYRAWDDAPLATKMALLILLAAVGGAIVGMAEAHMGHTAWVLGLGLSAVAVSLISLGNHWLLRPIERLLHAVERAARDGRPTPLNGLPLARRDEIGRLARVLHHVHMAAVRDHHEARRLRRSIDHRVEEATRLATRQLRRMVMRDALTDVGNRRFLEENLPLLVTSARESNTDLIAVALDMDNFKKVNDTLGHAAGDELLIFIASLIQASIRQADYVVRLGGDEFVILLPGADLDRANALIQQIQALFNQHTRTALPDEIKAGLSVGIASLKTRNAQTGPQLLEAADANLYDAKRAGKNQIVTDKPSPPPPR